MKLVNVEFVEKYLDFIMEEVKKGETFEIDHDGRRILIVPYQEYEDRGNLEKGKD